MIHWFRQKKSHTVAEETLSTDVESGSEVLQEVVAPIETPSKEGFLARFKAGLSKTRLQLGEGVARLLLGKKTIDASLVEALEELLVGADLGVELTQTLIARVTEQLSRRQLKDGENLYEVLKQQLISLLETHAKPLSLDIVDGPFVMLMVGVNGAGKTTTIAKLANQFQNEGKTVMLAAGDTFRAAAVEQLQTWGKRHQIPVIAQHIGADSASVIFDAYQAAKARNIDVLIADTAGRLHTQSHLMEELKKIKRVIQKINPQAPHEMMLVLDASIGQNALNQARQFNEAVGVTGITMTKLDGTAKGGILFAIAYELEIPFRYLGLGETISDLRPFEPSQFVGAIFNDD